MNSIEQFFFQKYALIIGIMNSLDLSMQLRLVKFRLFLKHKKPTVFIIIVPVRIVDVKKQILAQKLSS
jgi:hypothetical protein